MPTVYEIKAHVLPLLNNGSRIKVKIFMMTMDDEQIITICLILELSNHYK
jgi:antitoxin HigA-1